MKKDIVRFLVELTLWSVANLLCIGLATGAVYLVGTNFLDWTPVKMGAHLPLTAILTSTWGAWSSMVWARNRGVRIAMYISAAVPGVLTVVAGGAGLWIGFGAWFIWAGLILGGLAMIGVTVALCRQFNPRSHSVPALSRLYGVLIHPVVTLVTAGGIAALWYSFLSNPAGGWRTLVSISTLMATMLAIAMVTTVIPAAMSTLCRKMALESGDRLNGR